MECLINKCLILVLISMAIIKTLFSFLSNYIEFKRILDHFYKIKSLITVLSMTLELILPQLIQHNKPRQLLLIL